MIKNIMQVIDRATWSQLMVLGFAIGVALFAVVIGVKALIDFFYPKKRRDFDKRYGRNL